MFEAPMMEIPVPNINEIGLEIDNLLQERQSLKRTKDDCDERIHQIDEEIGQQLDRRELKTVVWNDNLVIRRQGSKPRPSLDRVLLLEAGVTPQQINAGTKFSEAGKPGVTVRALAEVKTKGLEEYSGY